MMAICGLLTVKAQVVISASATGTCGSASIVANLSLASAVPTASTYVWTLTGPLPSATQFTVITPVSNASITLPAAGVYSIMMAPYSGTTFISGSFAIGVYTLTTGPVVTAISSNSNICAGNSVTLTAAGATSYTWSNGSNGTTIVVTPTASTCYTVQGTTTGTCAGVAVKCINVNSVSPGVTVNQPASFNLCGGSALIAASGANAYSWSTGSTLSAITVTALGCYTVTGFNTCGNSSTVVCVTGTASAPPLSISGPTSAVCGASVITLSVPNATAFTNITWTGGSIPGCCPLTGGTISPTVNVNSCFTVTGTNGACSTTTVYCVSINNPFITTSPAGNYSTCQTSPTQVTASGAATYTWSWGANSFTGASFTPTAIGCYTVTGSNTVCPANIASTVVCLTAFVSAPTPTLFPGAACLGQPYSIFASGGNNYLAQTVVNGTPTNFTFTNFSSASVLQNTPGVYCATVTAFIGGCAGVAIGCYTVYPPLNPTITGASTVCAGSSVTLVASGATSYTWINGPMTNSMVISPTSSTCYSLAAESSNGYCYGIFPYCVTVVSPGTITIAASSPTVCKGSSVTFTAAGAAGFNWLGGPNTSTYNVIPTTSTIYTVSAIGANGCTGTKTVAVGVNTSCANVWPGDANSDGVVNTTDVLELGLQAGSTGAARTPGGNAYNSQFSTAWAGTISNGKNRCHADCNGDGTVNSNDTVAIFNNFSLTHAFKPAPAAVNDQITLVPNQPQLEIGRWNSVNVVLGSASDQVQAHGVGFEIAFENAKIIPDSIWIEFVSSAFTTNNDYLIFRKTQFSAGKINAAISRTISGDVTVKETIAVLHFKVNPQITVGSALNFAVNAAEKMDAAGVNTSVNGDSQSFSATDNLTSIAKRNAISFVTIYPNPAKDVVMVKGKDAVAYTVRVLDLSGRVLIDSKFTSNTNINVAALDNGVYLMEVSDASGLRSQRITIMH